MSEKIRPIQRSLIAGCAVFMLLLCLLLTIQSYLQFSVALYKQCQDRLKTVIQYVYEHVDRDDLRNCLNTRQPSVKYYELQGLLNSLIDPFELSYLYICYPSGNVMVNVVSATSRAERSAGESDLPMHYVSDAYSRDALALYQRAWKSEGITYFNETSDYGACYTGCLPLKSSDGDVFALLCADVYVTDLQRSVRSYAVVSAVITIVLSVGFAVLMISWLRSSVTGPVLALEKSARSFAEKSLTMEDLRRLRFEPPELHSWNEVASLSEAIAKMTEDLKKHVEDVYSAELRARSARIEAEDMSRIAYQDALTHVKNKSAYVVKAKELTERLQWERVEFAIVMVDVNFLKRINDTYGHECGDKYLIGACGVICDVFKHSPVFRIGGDEFLVVLEGHDYEQREQLLAEAGRRFSGVGQDEGLEPWERYSAACGMGVYAQGMTVEEVFQRADEEMYRNKAAMKGGRT